MKFSQKNIENWQFWKTQFFCVGHFDFFFRIFFASFPWKQVKIYWIARMSQHFDQTKCDSHFKPKPNILKGSVLALRACCKVSLSTLLIRCKIVYGSYGQINMHSTIDFCPRLYVLVRKEKNVPLHI